MGFRSVGATTERRPEGGPSRRFIDELTDEEVASIVAGMKDVVERGLPSARHLRGDIYEVRADAATRSFRLLFSAEGSYSQILLSLSVFEKRTQKTPPRELELAEHRLRDWRQRGTVKKKGRPRRADPSSGCLAPAMALTP